MTTPPILPRVTAGDLMAGGRVLARGRLKAPRLSVVTPTYGRDGEGLLRRCLDTAAAQTFLDFEHVVIDDGSDDSTEATVLEYARRDDRIVYVRHDRNCGLPAVRTNEGVLRSRGKAVAFLFDDCAWEPEFLARAWSALDGADAEVAHGAARFPLPDGEEVELGGVAVREDTLFGLNTIANTGVLCRRDFFDEVGLYDPHVSLRRVCDWDLWLRGVERGARFVRIEGCVGVEGGMISTRSLANAAPVDWTLALALLQDRDGLEARRRFLLPSSTADCDVLSPERLSRVVRSDVEADRAVEAFWRPVAAKLIGADAEAALDAVRSALRDAVPGGRRRSAVVCNRTTRQARSWGGRLRAAGTEVLQLAEWQSASVPAGDLDVVVLAGPVLPDLAPWLESHRQAGATVVSVQDDDDPSAEEADLLATEVLVRRLTRNPSLRLSGASGGASAGPRPGADVVVGSQEETGPGHGGVRAPEPAPDESFPSWLSAVEARVRLARRVGAAEGRLSVGLFLTGGMSADADARALALAPRLRRYGVDTQSYVPALSAWQEGDRYAGAPYALGSPVAWDVAERAAVQGQLAAWLETCGLDVLVSAAPTPALAWTGRTVLHAADAPADDAGLFAWLEAGTADRSGGHVEPVDQPAAADPVRDRLHAADFV